MTNPTIIKRLRKLLRLAEAPGPEGERARERANALMERHGIDKVSVDDRVRVEFPNISGVFWREQLLLAVAQATGVTLLEAEKDGKKRTAVQGERPDVETAITVYRRVAMHITAKCYTERQVRVPGMPPGHFAELVWSRIFHIGAATSLGASVQEQIDHARRERAAGNAPAVETVPQTNDTSFQEVKAAAAEQPPAQDQLSREKAQSDRDIAMLAALVGEDLANRIQEMAFQCGSATGRSISLFEKKLLPERARHRSALAPSCR